MNKLSNKVAVFGAMLLGMLSYATAASADVITDSIATAQSTVSGYATAVLLAVVALALFGAGIRIAPRVIRILASKVAG